MEVSTGWDCKRGRLVIDNHQALDECIDHLTHLGMANPPSEVFAHYSDGSVVSVGTFD